MSSDTPTLPDRKACANCGKEFTGGETTCTDDGTPLTPIRREGLSGIVNDKYEIMGTLGDGGWGTVYKAQHLLLKRPVAIKTLHRHMVDSGNALKRFNQEARAGSQLDHPHILRVFDYGVTADGVPYIVMDFLQGLSLAEALDAGGYMEPTRAMKIFEQVASALAHAHRNSVIHRDLKPANIMLVEHDGIPDYVKIVDFGIAKVLKSASEETSQLTETGQLFGSPLYMSPEQCTGKNLDGRSDIYSLGCVMYRTLTGQPPFHVRDLPDCIYKHVHETPAGFEYVCPEHPIPPEVEAIAFKCLSKNPMDRFQTMTELEETVKAWLAGKPLTLDSPVKMVIQTADRMPAVPGVSDTTTRIPAMSPPLAVSDKTPAKISSDLEITTDAGAASPVMSEESKLTAPQANNLNMSHMVALVATSLLLLLPIGYMVAQKSQHRSTPPIGPVDTKLISNAAHQEAQPNSAAQTASASAALKAGLNKFNDGHYDQAFKIFSTAAYSKQPGAQEASLWQGISLIELFRYSDAKKLLQDYMKHSDDKGVNSARALNGLGFAYSSLGQIDEAQGYFDRARVISNNLTGADRVVYAQTLRGLAELALHQRGYKNALMKLQAALTIDQQYGAPVLEIAYVENDMGQTYEYMKQFDLARKCYDTALTMRQNKMKDTNPLIAYSLKCIASVDYQQKKLGDAENRLKQALSITKQLLSDESLTEMQKAKLNLDIAGIYSSLGAISQAQKHFPLALQYYSTAYQIESPVLGENDPRTLGLRKVCDGLSRRRAR